MAYLDLTADAWIEAVPAGGSAPQMITVTLGEALVSIGAPDPLKPAVKIGGASGLSLMDGRTITVDPGLAVSIRPVGPRALITIGTGIDRFLSGLGIAGLGTLGINGLGTLGFRA